MDGSVAVLLVSHDGSRWLPTVLSRLAEQTVRPDRVVAVDTGSLDGSPDLLRSQLPTATLVELPRTVGYPGAVRAGMDALATPTVPPTSAEDDWVWLLHDDSAPAPDALERLLAARHAHVDAAVLGPKLREWPSLRRLLEVGVTISGTGRRETGLERGEYDEGQHDTSREVLAVNTAGMLVRRSVLDELGFDDALPLTHTELDFGWRAARAGHHVRVVPEAVVFHAEASRTGARSSSASAADRRRRDRGAALYTVLANCAGAALPFVAFRLLVGTLLRALGLLLVRAPRESGAELRALTATLLRPDRIARARRRRRAQASEPPRRVRHLLAPAWLPYRHGLDELAGIGTAVAHHAAAVTSDRGGDRTVWSRLRGSPGGWVVLVLSLVALVAARSQLGAGTLAGGALLPAPDSALDWWRDYLATGKDLSTGTTTTAPAYLLPLAVLATLLLGSAGLAVDLLLLGAVPLAALGAYRFLRHVAPGRWPAAWGAAAYAVLLATGGALGQGRIGTLVAAVVLPWLARAALGLLAGDPDRRWRAAWRTALWLALASSFAPLVWVVGAVLTLLAVPFAHRGARLGPVLAPVPVAALLLVPWTVLVWADHGWSALVLEAGRRAPELLTVPDAADVLGGRGGAVAAAPAWVGLPIAVVATLALLRRSTLRPVLASWAVAVTSLAVLWVMAGVELTGRGTTRAEPVWVGLLVLLVHGAWVTAAVAGSAGLRQSLSGRSFGWRQPVGLGVVLVALVTPVAGALWWGWQGNGNIVQRVADAPVPRYMDDAAERDPAAGTLVLTGDSETGYTHVVRRGHGLRLGEEAMLPPAGAQRGLTEAVSAMLTEPASAQADDLAERGIAFVHAPDPVDPTLSAALDAAPDLVSASADDEGQAWRVESGATFERPDAGVREVARPLLLVAQAAALVAVVVLAAPTRRRER